MTDKPDTNIKWNVKDAIGAVAHNIHHLEPVEKERVLLAVAVLYGIIEPNKPKPRPVPSMFAPKKRAAKKR